jgi:hypothetical protein
LKSILRQKNTFFSNFRGGGGGGRVFITLFCVLGVVLQTILDVYNCFTCIVSLYRNDPTPGADPGGGGADGQGGAHLKKLRRAEEGANILGVFRVKNHYFMAEQDCFVIYLL